MVDLQYLANRIELSFWSVAILLMSESPLVRRLLRLVYTWKKQGDSSVLIKASGWGAIAGLVFGLVLGILL